MLSILKKLKSWLLSNPAESLSLNESNPFQNTPDDIISHHIFPFLSLNDLAKVAQVNKQFHQLADKTIPFYDHGIEAEENTYEHIRKVLCKNAPLLQRLEKLENDLYIAKICKNNSLCAYIAAATLILMGSAAASITTIAAKPFGMSEQFSIALALGEMACGVALAVPTAIHCLFLHNGIYHEKKELSHSIGPALVNKKLKLL